MSAWERVVACLVGAAEQERLAEEAAARAYAYRAMARRIAANEVGERPGLVGSGPAVRRRRVGGGRASEGGVA